MASTSSAAAGHHMLDNEDDDDGFDWDAAVKEIDIACAQKSEINPRVSCVPGKANYFASSSRQTTLDRFITGPTRQNEGNDFCNYINNGEDEVREAEGNACFANIDLEAAKTWIYPVNIPRRDYQFNITRTALFSNTLVALPTGLGKTLIAAVVMYNYFRWFPEGKIVFAAPSRPLVLQQIEACHSIVGIPQEWTIDLTGQTNPTKRAHYWNTKRVFFVTPQVLEKDIFSGSCVRKDLVCLVIDEAHRATGNYSYCVVVRELLAVPVELRILALTATPGSKQQTVQHIIDNLQISRLEYRSESDPDVVPYVHDKKIELIEVALGNDAVEVNTLILDVIRPLISRLGAIGVLPSRDIQTFSPCDLLNSRDKFRQAPPGNLPQTKYGEIEGYFGALITLYHIRKLLSSHGIKPAFEMLQEKLQQGSFARLMSRNETLLKAKLVMQKNISHGAPSPKLSKLLEVLSDHFRMKDPQNSRVIIFSNFRGSVRDIMMALEHIEAVKATEFIGQSSGKTSKGQTQKVQQAVLQKFRAGGYNVIVATCIGEEGLDIMEVDLVICFDANISPLRMIQRMGRTGRKNEGRVVVLACEGSELKGYTRKQANSKAIKKHMQNGGTNSFQFRSSPRMIPHILKPEVQFVEISIEQFVPRTKKVDDDCLISPPAYEAKLTDAENDLVAKYFSHSEEISWRPSLIAFPHFQAFPSRVGKVVHSCRTGMLIDAMQNLQGLSFREHTKPFPIEDRASPETCLNSDDNEQCNHIMTELRSPMNYPKEDRREVSGSTAKPVEKINAIGDPFLQDPQHKNMTHSFLFNSNFIALDNSGRVMVLALPEFPLKRGPMSQSVDVNVTILPYHHKEAYVDLDSCKEKNDQVKDAPASQMRSHVDVRNHTYKLNHLSNVSEEQTLVVPNLPTPVLSQRLDGGENICGSPRERTPILFDDEGNEDLRDSELSPRLTNFIKSGIVPESPISISERLGNKEDELKVPDLVSTPVHSKLVVKSPKQVEEGVEDICGPEMNSQSSFINGIRTPVANKNKTVSGLEYTSPSPFIITPDTGCSKDWHLNSGDKSESLQTKHKLKRLRKIGDLDREPEDMKDQMDGPSRNISSLCVTAYYARNRHGRGKKQTVNDAKVFVEEEAEVSSDAGVSADEEDNFDNSFEDSFIDDRLNPTAVSTQAEVDMMAVYRRSLLSQSPLQIMRNSGGNFTPSSGVPRNESTSTSGTESHTVGKNFNGLESTARNAPSSSLNCIAECSDPMQSSRIGFPEEYGSKTENHKRRKLYQPGSLPIQNLEREFLVQSVASRKDSIQEDAKLPENEDIFDDDQFFNDIDLDAVEEEATRLFKYRTECSKQKPEPVPPNPAVLGAPSFDLGFDFEGCGEPI